MENVATLGHHKGLFNSYVFSTNRTTVVQVNLYSCVMLDVGGRNSSFFQIKPLNRSDAFMVVVEVCNS